MISHSIFKLHAEQRPDFTPPSAYELCTLIGMDSARNSMQSDHMLPVQLCSFVCCQGLLTRDQVHHLGRTIHYSHNRVLDTPNSW